MKTSNFQVWIMAYTSVERELAHILIEELIA
jgi:hypothetical protein